MELPFTAAEFFDVFAEYNCAFVVVAAALWLATLGALTFTWWRRLRRSDRWSLFLAALWLWNAVAYHALLFTRINPAAWLFAGLFATQAALFFLAARGSVVFFAGGPRRLVGAVLAVYALAYPFLTMASGHAYPATPTFGVPCPTTILTIGVLITARERIPVGLSLIPVAWGLIGGSAAVLLSVVTDYVLLGAAGLLTALLLGQHLRVVASSDQRP